MSAAASAATGMDTVTVTTSRGITCRVLVAGPDDGPAVVAFHGAGGHLAGEPMLGRLAAAGFRVASPVWPGFGPEEGETLLEDMQDFALHGADVVDALGWTSRRPHLIGHSMGAMIATEMMAMAPSAFGRLVLIDAAGLWLDEHPIPDLFALLPFEFPALLFHDAEAGAALLTGGTDFRDDEAVKEFLIANSRRLGTAGKILFPIPDRHVAKRLYRVRTRTLVVWGESDRFTPVVYGHEWVRRLPDARLVEIEGAGHMAPYERPDEVSAAVVAFLREA
jgi:pimeloyl-ACP methyl ester carboxylesterase